MLFLHLFLVMLLIISGCKGGDGNRSTPPIVGMDKLKEFEDNLEKLDTVTYMAVLKPVNSTVAGDAYGSFTFQR